jgi:hypothetical protein
MDSIGGNYSDTHPLNYSQEPSTLDGFFYVNALPQASSFGGSLLNTYLLYMLLFVVVVAFFIHSSHVCLGLSMLWFCCFL